MSLRIRHGLESAQGKKTSSAPAQAQKQCKTAMSALSFEDVPAAIKHLTDALRMLTQPGAAAGAPAQPRRR